MNHSRRLLHIFSSALILVGGSCATSRAAEKITISYGAFGRSIAVSDLRQLSETGKASRELASVLSVVGEEERKSLMGGLKFKVPLNVVVLDKILRSPQGEQLLTQVAEATSLPGGSEDLAIRSALIVAAASEEGLGMLSFLEAYPSQTLKIDLPAAQKLLKSGSMLGGFTGEQMPGGETPTSPPATDTPRPSEQKDPAAPPADSTLPDKQETPSPDSQEPSESPASAENADEAPN